MSASTRVSLLQSREVLGADGTKIRVGMPVMIENDDDGLDPNWPSLSAEERWSQIFALLELSLDFHDFTHGTVSSRRVDRTVNVFDFDVPIEH